MLNKNQQNAVIFSMLEAIMTHTVHMEYKERIDKMIEFLQEGTLREYVNKDA